MPKDFDQGQEGGEANFVVLGTNAFLEVVECDGLPAVLDDRPRDRDLDPQKLIAVAILAGPGLEEAGEAGDLRRVGVGEHGGE